MLGRYKKNAVIVFLGIALSAFMLGAAAVSVSSGDTAAKEELMRWTTNRSTI